jgi:dipeptidyl aminopeptidase/acylaminoacyl peptidase
MSSIAFRCGAAVFGLLGLAGGVVGQPLPQHALFRLEGHAGELYSVVWSPQDRYLVSSSDDRTVRLWDPATGEEIRRLGPFPHGVPSLQFSPVDDKLVALAVFDGSVRLYDSDTGRELWKTHSGDHVPRSLAFAPDGNTIATGGDDGTIVIWNAADGKRRLTITAHERLIRSLAFSPDGRTLASGGGGEQTAALWDPTTGERVHPLCGFDRIEGVAFSPDGKTVALVGSYEKYVWLCETASGKERLKIPHALAPHAVAFSPDGRTLVTGAQVGDTAYLWDADTGQELLRLSGHTKFIYGLAFSHDGKRLATASYDRTVLVWDVKAITKRPSVRRKLEQRELDAYGGDIGSLDGERAYRAVVALASAPEQASAWFAEYLRPEASPFLPKLLADLDADDFDVREAASHALQKQGWSTVPGLREELKRDNLSPEARRRIGRILEVVGALPVSESFLRPRRAIETLERIGSEDGRKLLERMTAKEFGADVVEEAKASLARLKRASNRP